MPVFDEAPADEDAGDSVEEHVFFNSFLLRGPFKSGNLYRAIRAPLPRWLPRPFEAKGSGRPTELVVARK